MNTFSKLTFTIALLFLSSPLFASGIDNPHAAYNIDVDTDTWSHVLELPQGGKSNLCLQREEPNVLLCINSILSEKFGSNIAIKAMSEGAIEGLSKNYNPTLLIQPSAQRIGNFSGFLQEFPITQQAPENYKKILSFAASDPSDTAHVFSIFFEDKPSSKNEAYSVINSIKFNSK